MKRVKKRAIPVYPQKIGIITSKQGAVLADFLSNIGSYGFKIKMVDSRVEGQSAITDLLSAIKTIKKKDIEVLVIMRGGGSFESLQPFNNELLVREVANFPVPVIAAIGHDKDIPLVSLAADLEVSTPSIAAITLSKSWKEALVFLERYAIDIINAFEVNIRNANSSIDKLIGIIEKIGDSIINKYRVIKNKLKVSLQIFKNNLLNTRINSKNYFDRSMFGFNLLLSTAKQQSKLKISFLNFQNTLINMKTDVKNCSKTVISRLSFLLSRFNQDLDNFEKNINHNNPEHQLGLGYGIAMINGKIVRNISDVEIGKYIDLRVVNGIINSQVKNINKINKK